MRCAVKCFVEMLARMLSVMQPSFSRSLYCSSTARLTRSVNVCNSKISHCFGVPTEKPMMKTYCTQPELNML